MKRASIYLIAVLLVSALISSVALATGVGERLRHVISAGGTDASNGAVMLTGTLGQPVVGGTSANGFVITQGYWSGGGLSTHLLYLPIVLEQ